MPHQHFCLCATPSPLCCKVPGGGPVEKPRNKKRRKGKTGDASNVPSVRDVEIVAPNGDADQRLASASSSTASTLRSLAYHPQSIPKPPSGFVVDDTGRILKVSNTRIVTIVSDEEVEAILPTAAYALAKIHMHLVHSGERQRVLEGRAFRFSSSGILLKASGMLSWFSSDMVQYLLGIPVCEIIYVYAWCLNFADHGQDIDSLPTEGIEVTCFHLDGAHYMIYTPSDPLVFVAVKDQNGMLQIADDDLLDDPAVTSAIDEETEFNALVEEEAALLESVLGEK
ncbi:hypothetical protein V6N13_085763 [Hibiscus sabdariffa]